jgi:NADH-quinone oxidoreductase subunit M
MVFISMASIGLPGLNGFVGEMLSLAGMFRRHPVYAVIGTTGVVLGAWYLLGMLQHAFFGPLREPAHGDHPIVDINAREALAIAPICALCLWIGLMPQPILNVIRPDVDAVVELYDQDNTERIGGLEVPWIEATARNNNLAHHHSQPTTAFHSLFRTRYPVPGSVP